MTGCEYFVKRKVTTQTYNGSKVEVPNILNFKVSGQLQVVLTYPRREHLIPIAMI
jgi:hypothetical protein